LRYRVLIVFGILLAVFLVQLLPWGGGKLKVMAVYHTSIEEPWVACIHQALLKAERALEIDYGYDEKVASQDYDRVLYGAATGGYDVVFGDAFDNEQTVRDIASDYHEVYFVFGSALGPAEPNLAVFDDWIHEPAYLCGMIAGKLTQTGIVGAVGGYPVPEVNRLINAYRLGVKEVNPQAQVKVAFIDDWYDPQKARAAALALIDEGADLIYAERDGAIEAASERGVLAFGNLVDQNSVAPDTVVTGPVWDLWPTVNHVLTAIKEGDFQAIDYREWSMMAKGGAYLAPYHGFDQKLPAEVKDMVSQRQDEILTGRFVVPVDESTPQSD